MSKSAQKINDSFGGGLAKFQKIPTDDSQAALEFCRALVCHLNDAQSTCEATVRPAANPPLGVSISQGAPELSVILPVYNEQANINELSHRIRMVLDQVGITFEIICVDDGSRDGSVESLEELSESDSRFITIELARNFGHQVAITAGLDHARGKAVIVMDADLQDPPEVLPQFIAKWREGYDVVYAVRENRKEGWFKRSCYAFFYRLLARVASVEIPLDSGDFCIMDRRVVELLGNMPERNRFIRGIRSWVGLKQIGLPFERQARFAGESKYTFSRLMILALDGLISFSYLPLRFITILGVSVSALSMLMAVFYVVKKLLYGLTPPGFATVIVSIFFLAGVQLITLGVIGEYVGRIFDEAKRRPLYVLKRIVRTS